MMMTNLMKRVKTIILKTINNTITRYKKMNRNKKKKTNH